MHHTRIVQVLGKRAWYYTVDCVTCSWVSTNYSYTHLERQALEHGRLA